MVSTRTPDELRLLRLLQRYPHCIRQVDIVLTTDMTPHDVTQALRALRMDGLAAMTAIHGPHAAWGTPENVAVAKAARAAMLKAEAQRARAVGRLNVAEKAAEDAETEAFARPSAKRIVHRGEWARPAVAGPFSVFTQGASA